MHTVLKRETGHWRRRLNTLPNARALVTPELSISDCGRILFALSEVHNHIEPHLMRLEKTVRLGLLQEYIPRLPNIIADMPCIFRDKNIKYKHAENLTPIEAQIPEHYFGLRYAIDGSTQGGRFIERRLRENLPELATRVFSYWDAQMRAGEQWPMLCATLNQM